MKEKLPKILLVLFLLLLTGNLLFLDYRLFFTKSESVINSLINESVNNQEKATDSAELSGCNNQCQQLIDQKISQALTNLPTIKPQKSTTVLVPTTASQTKISYIPLMTEATINSADWQDITPSDFYFDINDYQGLKNVRFEVYLKSQYQSGKVAVRLYDVTNKRGVDYSDLSSSLEAFELVRSSDLSIWRGNNLYRLQGKTASGIEGYLKDAKIKIVQ